MLLRGSEFVLAQTWLKEAEENKKVPLATLLQRTYIKESYNAIAARERREKRLNLILKALVGLSSSVAIIAATFGTIAVQKQHELQIEEIEATVTSSEALFALDRQLDALVEAIEANEEVRDIPFSSPQVSDLEMRAEAILRRIVYNINEYNNLAGHTAPVVSGTFSPSNKWIVTGGTHNRLIVWEADGTQLYTLEAHNGSILDVEYHPIDDNILASSSIDGTVKLWQIESDRSPTFLTVLKGHDQPIADFDFSPDGNFIATASDDGTAKLWRVAENKPQVLATFKTNSDSTRTDIRIKHVSFSPDGRILVVGDNQGTLGLWQVEDEENSIALAQFQAHEKAIRDISFAPEGEEILSVSEEGTIKIWDMSDLDNLADPEPKSILDNRGIPVNTAQFSPNGEFVASSGDDRTIKIWNREGLLLETFRGHNDGITELRFAKDSQQLLSVSRDNTARLWLASDRGLVKSLYGHRQPVRAVAFHPQGQMLAAADRGGILKLWGYEDGQMLASVGKEEGGHVDEINDLVFTQDGTIVLSASEDSTIKWWDVRDPENPTLLQTIEVEHQADSLGLSPDDRIFAYGNRDGRVFLHRQGEEQPFSVLQGHTDSVTGVVFSARGEIVVTVSSDDTLRFWNYSGTLLKTISAHDGPITSAIFSPDGESIATGSADNTAKIWTRQGDLKGTIQHDETVHDVAFSSDSQTLATASADRTVKLWSIEGNLKMTLSGATDTVYSVAFSPDDHTVAAASADRTLKLWEVSANLDRAGLLYYACQWASDYLRTNIEVEDDHRALCQNS